MWFKTAPTQVHVNFTNFAPEKWPKKKSYDDIPGGSKQVGGG